jgi:hypothetical protein
MDVLDSRYNGHTVTSNINNDLTSGKGYKADLERVISYFWNVLILVIPVLGIGPRFSIEPVVQQCSLDGRNVVFSGIRMMP